jgi:hypothetical protein
MTGYISDVGAVVTTPGYSNKNKSPETATQANFETSKTKTGKFGGLDIAPWGDDNDFPNRVIDICKLNSVIPSAINLKAKKLYGQGVIPIRVLETDDEGNETIEIVKDTEVVDWLRFNNINRYMVEATRDLYWFFNTFPELHLNPARNKITRIHLNQAAYTRLQKMDPSSRRIEHAYISAAWPSPKDGEWEKVEVLDQYDPYQDLLSRKNEKIYKYVMPVNYPVVPGQTYYQLSYWDGARVNGWIEIANSIPALKRALFKNQMTIKYHVRIPIRYWEIKYAQKGEDWSSIAATVRNSIIEKELTNLRAFLSGNDNAGKAFISHYETDPQTGKALPGWEIIPLDDKLKDGSYLPDSAAANSEILFALQMDPSQMGMGMPGGAYANKSGSGSEKRESFLIDTAVAKMEQDIILEPFNVIRDFNRWDPAIEWRFKGKVLTTLDQGRGTKKVVS